MDRTSRLYRFLKRCETPPRGSRTWLLLGMAYDILLILLGRILCRSRRGEFILVPPFSMGDVLLLYRSFPELKAANGLSDPTILAAGNLLPVIRSLGMGKAEALPQWKIIAMCKAVLFAPDRFGNIVLSQAWHFMDVRELRPDAELGSLPLRLREQTREFLFPDPAMEGKCMILSPYEQTFLSIGEPQLPREFWEELAAALQSRGYTVFTNCDGKKELPIRGTRVFFPPLGELSGAVEYAGSCIAVRSGFCDWASSAPTAKQAVLYPSRSFRTRFSMAAVWGREDVTELVYDLEDLTGLRADLLGLFVGGGAS